MRGGNMPVTGELTPRQETLVTFLGAGNKKLDPIRIQKGLFLLAMETPEDWLPSEARYAFEPYHYGPYSVDINRDLEELQRRGYLEITEVLGRSWNYYSLSPEGSEAVRGVSERMDARTLEYVGKLREFVGRLPFNRLLTKVYDKYPSYAVNSVFKR